MPFRNKSNGSCTMRWNLPSAIQHNVVSHGQWQRKTQQQLQILRPQFRKDSTTALFGSSYNCCKKKAIGHERFLPSSACLVVRIWFQLSSYRGKHPGGYITLPIPKAQLLQCGLTFSPSYFSPLQSLVALLKYSCRAFLIKQRVV